MVKKGLVTSKAYRSINPILHSACRGEVLVLIVCVCVCVCVCVRVHIVCVRVLCVCVCVSVTTLAGAMSPLKAKVRYQQKALDAGNKTNVGMELKILGLKVVTVASLL